MKRLLIAGCGDLGQRLAAVVAGKGWQVTGLRRRAEVLQAPIRPLSADLSRPDTLVPVAGHWDAVVYQATPDERSEAGYRRAYRDGLANLLELISTPRLLFVSSTAVYGEDQGSWVDEDTPPEPQRFNGQIMLEAEDLAGSAGGICVRFSGIYGPGREYLLRSVRTGKARCRRTPPQWTNRIHVDDCAGVLAHLLDLDRAEPVYCATDNLPAPRCEVLDWLATRLGVEPPAEDDQAEGCGKRISNRRLTSSGYRFLYPDFRSGYASLLP